MTLFVTASGLVNETSCAGCGWPMSSCLCTSSGISDCPDRGSCQNENLISELKAEVARLRNLLTELTFE